MAISLSSLVLVALLGAPPPQDSTAALWARVRQDSLDATAWLQLGRAYLRRPVDDTAVSRAVLDTADLALARAIGLGSGAVADSASTFRLFGWGERALLAWRAGENPDAAETTWGMLPDDARLSPALEELGENLLRACPERGLLLTAGDADTYAASYLRYVRRLRPDVTVMPLDFWPAAEVEKRLRTAGERRPLCASMAFERPPSRGVRWQARPLVWVAGRTKGTRDVPAQDFVFAALRLALDESSAWAASAVQVYRRAVRNTPALCRALASFEIAQEAGCR